jgi:hypothetical protein
MEFLNPAGEARYRVYLGSLYLTGINQMALRVSAEAQEIDVNLRDTAAKDAKRFAHLKAKIEKRDMEPVKKKKGSGSGWQEKIEKMRETHPNAYKPWETQDDETLKTGFVNGETIAKLSKKLGRHEGSIKMRLQKHFGEDAVQ